MSKFIFVNLLLLKISFALEWRFQNIFYDNKTIANTIFLSLEIENKDQRLEKLKNILDDMTEYQKDILTRTLFWYKEFEKIQKQKELSWEQLSNHCSIVTAFSIISAVAIGFDSIAGGESQIAQRKCVDEHACPNNFTEMHSKQNGYICLNGTMDYECAHYTKDNNLTLNYVFNCSSQCIDFCTDIIGNNIPYIDTVKIVNYKCRNLLAILPFSPSMAGALVIGSGLTSLVPHALKYYFIDYRKCSNFELVPGINNMTDFNKITEKLNDDFEDINDILKLAIDKLRIKVGYEGST